MHPQVAGDCRRRRRSRIRATSVAVVLLSLASPVTPLLQPFHTPHRYTPRSTPLSLFNKEKELSDIEKRVKASAEAQVDRDLIVRALEAANLPAGDSSDLLLPGEQTKSVASSWQIALSASAVLSTASWFVLPSLYTTVGVAVLVFALALRADDNSVTGAVARTVGRATIESMEASQPKVRALARAVVTGEEEIVALKAQVKQLQEETAALQRWKDQRNFVDENLSQYSLDELKEKARGNGLMVGGTKAQLMMRLLEAGVLEL